MKKNSIILPLVINIALIAAIFLLIFFLLNQKAHNKELAIAEAKLVSLKINPEKDKPYRAEPVVEEHKSEVPHDKLPSKDPVQAPNNNNNQPDIVSPKPKSNKKTISIIVGGLGLSKSTTEKALELPANVTFGFSPYGQNLEEYSSKLVGKDILINLPLEPTNYPGDDPGPYALLTELSDKDNAYRLDWVVSRINGTVGVYTLDDEKFSLSLKSMKLVFETLKNKKHAFIYGGGAENIALNQFAKNYSYPFLIIDYIIDKDVSASAIHEKLGMLEQRAIKNGSAIALASPYPITLKILEEWAASLKNKNIELIPISQMFKNS